MMMLNNFFFAYLMCSHAVLLLTILTFASESVGEELPDISNFRARGASINRRIGQVPNIPIQPNSNGTFLRPLLNTFNSLTDRFNPFTGGRVPVDPQFRGFPQFAPPLQSQRQIEPVQFNRKVQNLKTTRFPSGHIIQNFGPRQPETQPQQFLFSLNQPTSSNTFQSSGISNKNFERPIGNNENSFKTIFSASELTDRPTVFLQPPPPPRFQRPHSNLPSSLDIKTLLPTSSPASNQEDERFRFVFDSERQIDNKLAKNEQKHLNINPIKSAATINRPFSNSVRASPGRTRSQSRFRTGFPTVIRQRLVEQPSSTESFPDPNLGTVNATPPPKISRVRGRPIVPSDFPGPSSAIRAFVPQPFDTTQEKKRVSPSVNSDHKPRFLRPVLISTTDPSQIDVSPKRQRIATALLNAGIDNTVTNIVPRRLVPFDNSNKKFNSRRRLRPITTSERIFVDLSKQTTTFPSFSIQTKLLSTLRQTSVNDKDKNVPTVPSRQTFKKPEILVTTTSTTSTTQKQQTTSKTIKTDIIAPKLNNLPLAPKLEAEVNQNLVLRSNVDSNLSIKKDKSFNAVEKSTHSSTVQNLSLDVNELSLIEFSTLKPPFEPTLRPQSEQTSLSITQESVTKISTLNITNTSHHNTSSDNVNKTPTLSNLNKIVKKSSNSITISTLPSTAIDHKSATLNLTTTTLTSSLNIHDKLDQLQSNLNPWARIHDAEANHKTTSQSSTTLLSTTSTTTTPLSLFTIRSLATKIPLFTTTSFKPNSLNDLFRHRNGGKPVLLSNRTTKFSKPVSVSTLSVTSTTSTSLSSSTKSSINFNHKNHSISAFKRFQDLRKRLTRGGQSKLLSKTFDDSITNSNPKPRSFKGSRSSRRGFTNEQHGNKIDSPSQAFKNNLLTKIPKDLAKPTRTKTKKTFSTSSIKVDDVSKFLPKGFKSSLSSTTTQKSDDLLADILKNIDETDIAKLIALNPKSRQPSSRRSRPPKIFKTDDVSAFLPPGYTEEKLVKSTTPLAKIFKVDDVSAFLPSGYKKEKSVKSTTPVTKIFKMDEVSAFLPPGYKEEKLVESTTTLAKISKVDDVSAFLPPGYKEEKSVRNTTPLTKIFKVNDVSAFLPPGYKKEQPLKEPTTFVLSSTYKNLAATSELETKSKKVIPSMIKLDNVLSFLPKDYSTDLSAIAENSSTTNAPIDETKLSLNSLFNNSVNVLTQDAAAFVPPEYEVNKAEHANADRVLFPKISGANSRNEEKRIKIGSNAIASQPVPLIPKITSISERVKTRKEFSGWKELYAKPSTPKTVPTLVPKSRATSSTTTSPPTTTTSTTSTLPPVPTTPGVCGINCRLAATIKITQGYSWTNGLLDPNTEEYKNMSESIIRELSEAYRNSVVGQSFDSIVIEAFSKGSLIVDYYVNFKNMAESIETTDLKKVLNEQFDGSRNTNMFIIDPKYTDFIVTSANEDVSYSTNFSHGHQGSIPDWAIAVIVIGLGSLAFVVIFGVTVILNKHRQRNGGSNGFKLRNHHYNEASLTEDMLHELNKGGIPNYTHGTPMSYDNFAHDHYVDDEWGSGESHAGSHRRMPPTRGRNKHYHQSFAQSRHKGPSNSSSGYTSKSSPYQSQLYDSWKTEWNGQYLDDNFRSSFQSHPVSTSGATYMTKGGRRPSYDDDF